MDIRSLIDQVISIAHTASAILPGAGLVEQAGKIGKGILDTIDAVQSQATPDQQAELQAARAKLAASVTAKAKATSDRLRG